MDKDQGIEAAARVLEKVLQDGDDFFVRKDDGGVEILTPEEIEPVELADEHPELFGHLLEVNQELSDTGSKMTVFGLLAAVVLCVAVHLQWIDSVLGIDAGRVRSFWAYALFVGASFMFLGQIVLIRESRVYRRQRSELLEHIRRAGLTRRTVLAKIHDDPQLATVADKLKSDRGTDRAGMEPYTK